MTSFPPNLKGFIAINVQLLGLLDEHCLDLLRELEQGSQNGQTEVADADETLQQPQAYPLAGVVSLCILIGLSEGFRRHGVKGKPFERGKERAGITTKASVIGRPTKKVIRTTSVKNSLWLISLIMCLEFCVGSRL